jgi:hypothetical protein
MRAYSLWDKLKAIEGKVNIFQMLIRVNARQRIFIIYA